jgi:predicted CXXCH cytochrome family protein
MHRMTRTAKNADIHAPFAGETFSLQGDTARLFQSQGERRLELVQRDGKKTEFRVTKVIGGRYREDFVGVELAPNEPQGARGEERVLPVSYLIFDHSYRYKGYSVLVTERPSLEPGQTWRQTCIFCHNTAPALSTLLDELHGPGSPSYQGSASDDAPPDRRFLYTVRDASGLASAVNAEVARLGAPLAVSELPALLPEAMRRTRQAFDEQHLIELGIGCEACHGGGREHASAPHATKPSFAPNSPFFEVRTANGAPLSPALEVNRACAKCHTVLFSRYPYTWEGGGRRADPGGSPINSGEARDFLLGDCRTALSCTHCHDPHGEDSRERLDALAAAPGDRLCTNCHRQLADPVATRAHTHHAPESEGSRCVNCHMPRKNLGLAYRLTRYHRIGSPTDAARVEGDRPLECALCHADKSVDQIVSTMERWWNRRYDRGRLQKLYGADLSIAPLRATLLGGLPHEQAVAAAVAAENGRDELLPLVTTVLESDYPLVRYFAKRAAEQLAHAPVPVDPGAPRADIARAIEAWNRARAAPTSDVR